MSKFIGRLLNIAIAKESVRGTAETPTYWLPKMELTVDDKIEQAVNESSLGVIADAENANIVKEFSEGELKGRIDNTAFGLWLLATFGKEGTPTIVGGETIVYDHTFTIKNDCQHPSLTIATDDPNGDLDYVLGMVDSLEINVELGKYAEYTAAFKANRSGSDTLTPSYSLTENIFLPQHGQFKIADDITNLDAADPLPIKRVTLTISKNLEDDQTIGNVAPSDRLNKQFVIEGAVELLYDDRVLIDAMGDDLKRAIRIKLVNPSVTLGVASNPQLTFDLPNVKIAEIARNQANNDLISMTLSFKAFYSLVDEEMVFVYLRNLKDDQY